MKNPSLSPGFPPRSRTGLTEIQLKGSCPRSKRPRLNLRFFPAHTHHITSFLHKTHSSSFLHLFTIYLFFNKKIGVKNFFLYACRYLFCIQVLKAPKCKIFHLSDFHDFYTPESDFGAEIQSKYFNFGGR